MSWLSAEEALEAITERREREHQRTRRERMRAILRGLPPPPTEETPEPTGFEHDLSETRRSAFGSRIGVCICGWSSIPCRDEMAARRAVYGHIGAKKKQP